MEPKTSSLPGYFTAILLLQITVLPSEQFTVLSSKIYQVVTVGRQAEFSCQLFPPQSAQHMEVGWFWDSNSQRIDLDTDGEEHSGEGAQRYVNRTAILKDGLREGKTTLVIYNISVFDQGIYHCFFKDGNTYKETTAELRVADKGLQGGEATNSLASTWTRNEAGTPASSLPYAPAMGTDIRMKVQISETEGLLVECESEGWFPQAEMKWRDSRGNTIPPSLKNYFQDAAGLFHLKMNILLKNNSHGPISCCIFNPVTGQEKRAGIVLPDTLLKPEYLAVMTSRNPPPLKYLIVVLAFQFLTIAVQQNTHRFTMVFTFPPVMLFIAFLPVYLTFRSRVFVRDDLHPLFSTWMNDLCLASVVPMIIFALFTTIQLPHLKDMISSFA